MLVVFLFVSCLLLLLFLCVVFVCLFVVVVVVVRLFEWVVVGFFGGGVGYFCMEGRFVGVLFLLFFSLCMFFFSWIRYPPPPPPPPPITQSLFDCACLRQTGG